MSNGKREVPIQDHKTFLNVVEYAINWLRMDKDLELLLTVLSKMSFILNVSLN